MKTLFKYIIVTILASAIMICCGCLMLIASVAENITLIALCVAGAIAGAFGVSYLIAEVE